MKTWKKLKPFLFLLSIVPLISYGQNIVPHIVPEEFASDQYQVSINGQTVPVFHAGLNVYFASFDFNGQADIEISTGKEDAKYVGQTSNKAAVAGDAQGFWKGNAQVRPLSRNIKVLTKGATVRFSLKEAGQYSIERPGTSNFKDEVLFLFANPSEKEKT